MARLEALLAPAADGERLREAMASLARELGGIFSWLDGRNASITLTAGPRALAVQVLLERLLAGLQAAAPGAAVRYRSDRDGPIRQTVAA